MEMAKGKVSQTFAELEKLEEKESVAQSITRQGGITRFLGNTNEGPIDFGLPEDADGFVYDLGGVELQSVTVDDFLSLEMPFYVMDEVGQPVSLETLAGGGAELEAVTFDLLPTLAQAGDMLFGIAAGVVGGFAIQGLVNGFGSVVQALNSKGWIHTGSATQAAASSTMAIVNEWKDEYFDLNENLAKYFQENPTYVWVFDDGLNSSPRKSASYTTYDWAENATKGTPVEHIYDVKYGHNYGAWWNSHLLSGTNLWLRGRVMTMNGKKLGYSDDIYNTLVLLKFGNGDVASGRAAYGTPMFWVNADIARMLDDSDNSKRRCLQSNLSSHFFRGMEWPWKDDVEPSSFQPQYGEFQPLTDFDFTAGGTSGTVVPGTDFFSSTGGGGGVNFGGSDFVVQGETGSKYPPQIDPGRDKVRFDEKYYELLRGKTISMPYYMYVDYVKDTGKDDIYLLGGHVAEKLQNTKDRYLFQVPYNAYLETVPQEFRWKPLRFSVDKNVYGDTIFAESSVGQMLTDIESGVVSRVKGKFISDSGEKALLLIHADGEDVSEIYLQYLRPSTQAETSSWLAQFDEAGYIQQQDDVHKQWAADHPTKPPPSVPKTGPPGQDSSGTADTEKLRLALTELADLRRRLVISQQGGGTTTDIALRQPSEPPPKKRQKVDDQTLEEFLFSAKTIDVPQEAAVEGGSEFLIPVFVFGGVVLLILANS